MFALSTGICIKHGNNKNYPDTPSTENGQYKKKKKKKKNEIGESTRHKWVNLVIHLK